MGSSIVIRFCLYAFLELFAVLAGTSSTRSLTKTKNQKKPAIRGLAYPEDYLRASIFVIAVNLHTSFSLC
ncbi:TPA: hypothetical protein RQN15_001949 [Aeromonas hydrophila]|nr:hypothetical protein [Aeromonas hydrophila]